MIEEFSAALRRRDFGEALAIIDNASPDELNSKDQRECTSLMLAAYYGLIEVVDKLFEKGARDNDGHFTALMCAILGRQEETALPSLRIKALKNA